MTWQRPKGSRAEEKHIYNHTDTPKLHACKDCISGTSVEGFLDRAKASWLEQGCHYGRDAKRKTKMTDEFDVCDCGSCESGCVLEG